MFKLDKLHMMVKKTLSDVDQKFDQLITPRKGLKDFQNAWQMFNRIIDQYFGSDISVFESNKILEQLTKNLR